MRLNLARQLQISIFANTCNARWSTNQKPRIHITNPNLCTINYMQCIITSTWNSEECAPQFHRDELWPKLESRTGRASPIRDFQWCPSPGGRQRGGIEGLRWVKERRRASLWGRHRGSSQASCRARAASASPRCPLRQKTRKRRRQRTEGGLQIVTFPVHDGRRGQPRAPQVVRRRRMLP